MLIGSTVTLIAEGRSEDGTLFLSATKEAPMTFQTGNELTLPGFEKGVLEMTAVGEKKTFTVPCYEGFGEYREDDFEVIPFEVLPRSNVKVGDMIWVMDEEGNRIPITAVSHEEDGVRFDMNHPLAGQELTFEVEIIELVDAPEDFVSAEEKRKQLERMAPSSDSFGELMA